MFSAFPKINFKYWDECDSWFANVFNLDKSEILSSGKELTLISKKKRIFNRLKNSQVKQYAKLEVLERLYRATGLIFSVTVKRGF